MKTRISCFFAGIVLLIPCYRLVRFMENNASSAGDDDIAKWDAGDLNGLLLFVLFPLAICVLGCFGVAIFGEAKTKQ